MRRIRIIGLCLVSICATAATAATGASAAQPEFYGKAAIGSKVPTLIAFTATIGATSSEDKSSKAKTTCTGGTATGEVTGLQTVKHEVITYTGCETGTLPCKSLGQAEGTIVTNALEGTLGSITATLAGLRLFKEGEKGKEPKAGALEEFECGGGVEKDVVNGSIVGSLSGTSKSVESGKFATLKVTFTQVAGAQKYTKFLAGECGGLGECGPEQLTATINGAPELRGKAETHTIRTSPFPENLGVTD